MSICSKERRLAGLLPRLILASSLLAVATATFAQPAPSAQQPTPLRVDEQGTIQTPPMTIPLSSYLSPEGKAFVAEHLNAFQKGIGAIDDNGVPEWMKGYLASARKQFNVERQDTSIGGVHSYVYTPRDGVLPQNRRRVLINLHGGGFGGCFPGCTELESLPIAGLGRIKVVSPDYRQGPKSRFPAASEDVTAVYRELLKSYKPGQIGVYGCSAGGMLVGQFLAWIQKEGLPNPGAAGIYCSGLSFGDVAYGGDATYIGLPLGDAAVPPPPLRSGQKAPVLPYFEGADLKGPLTAPALHPDVLARFPPTMFATSTRAFDYSAAIYAHRQLVNAGVKAELNMWEGLPHGFIYNPDIPESKDFFQTVLRYFDSHLSR